MKPKVNSEYVNEYKALPENVEKFAKEIVDASYKVHTIIGPGLLESVYEECLKIELESRGLKVKRQTAIPIVYEGIKLDSTFILDMVVEDCLIIELKAVKELHPVYKAQVLTYLQLTGMRLGILVNFGSIHLKDNIFRLIK